MNDDYVKALNNQTFNQDGNESAVLKPKYYNPPNRLILYFNIYRLRKKSKIRR